MARRGPPAADVRGGALSDATELVILVGLPGCGKTTFYRDHFAATHEHVSKDLWPHARRREERQRRVVDQALAAGRSVVVDNTNPRAGDRAPLIELAQHHGARVVGYAFTTPIGECRRRNAGRSGRARVPDKVLFITRARLEWPHPEEGFDALHRVELTPADTFDVTPWQQPSAAD